MKKLAIYDKLRQFHKNFLVPTIWRETKLTNFEKESLETLSGVLYLVENVFADEEPIQ